MELTYRSVRWGERVPYMVHLILFSPYALQLLSSRPTGQNKLCPTVSALSGGMRVSLRQLVAWVQREKRDEGMITALSAPNWIYLPRNPRQRRRCSF